MCENPDDDGFTWRSLTFSPSRDLGAALSQVRHLRERRGYKIANLEYKKKLLTEKEIHRCVRGCRARMTDFYGTQRIDAAVNLSLIHI